MRVIHGDVNSIFKAWEGFWKAGMRKGEQGSEELFFFRVIGNMRVIHGGYNFSLTA